MARSTFVDALLGGLAADMRSALKRVFEYVLDGNLRSGPVAHQTRAENFAWVYLNSTTPSTANTEFSILHGLDSAPSVLFPCLDLTAVGAQMVPLTVSKAPDSKRVYLKSSSTNAVITVRVE